MRVQRKIKLKDVPKVGHEIKPRMESSRRDFYVPPKNQRSKENDTPYNRFKAKYNDLEKYIDSFNGRDLTFYFRECAEENGQRYYIANIAKDGAIFKRLLSSYEPREICGMIEFLFTSEQDYLEKNRLSPNLLASGWINTIYEDYKLWVNDEYVPRSKQTTKKKRNDRHEWNEQESESRVGGWE